MFQFSCYLSGSSCWWAYCSWIYNYLCNQCLPPLTLRGRISLMARCTRYNIMWWSLSVTWYNIMWSSLSVTWYNIMWLSLSVTWFNIMWSSLSVTWYNIMWSSLSVTWYNIMWSSLSVTWYNIMWSSLSVNCGRLVVFSTNKTDHHDINEILLKVVLNTITLTLTPSLAPLYWYVMVWAVWRNPAIGYMRVIWQIWVMTFLVCSFLF
jgi:hypothetical protein